MAAVILKTKPRCRFDPSRGERLGPAWDRILTELANHRWRRRAEVVEAVLPASNLKTKSIDDLLYKGVQHGYLERRGRLQDREIRLVTKNTNCECGVKRK